MEFVIDNDTKAEWALRKIREEDAELARMTEWYERQLKAVKEQHDQQIEYFTSLLRDYFLNVPKRETKTTTKYTLPSATLVMAKPHDECAVSDKAALVSWCMANDAELVKMELAPRWADIKARLKVVDGRIVDSETGLEVDGVTVQNKPEEFKVRMKEETNNGTLQDA